MPNDRTVYLKDYAPPAYRIARADLRFELDEANTLVHAKLAIRAQRHGEPLRLHGEALELLSIALDGGALAASAYRVEDGMLVIDDVPAEFILETTSRIHPNANTALEGLYVSGGNFCTQCEAEGFRKITWFIDRPDNMTVFTTRIEADRARYPVLLSNGNCVGQGELADGRHFAEWHDPFPKPSYLFALVAGDLACLADHFTTASGRSVALRLYVQHGNEDKAQHAMASLKKAMRWDEEVYGREYDLDVYMIVAVDDFNMGAMENKGLNVFNSRYVLARPETATDADFMAIEGVIAHEYFHNWSGNRITCRDWFQLSLKEGFTVLRDQQFSEDMTSGPVARIGEVGVLRSQQFREDAGPMAHPVRPPSYQEINNFYTLTVYNKGAEVVRMLRTLLGATGFRRGTDLYFSRHDGQAVTTDDFVHALEDANRVDLARFRRWYDQAGTPEVSAYGDYDEGSRRYTLRLSQHTPATPGQPEKLPFHIPVTVALLGGDGSELPLRLEHESAPNGTSRVLELTEDEQSFVFADVSAAPVPSLLRGFSAPVKLTFPYTDADLAFLMAHDADPFNRWDASQRLALGVMLRALDARRSGVETALDAGLSQAFATTLRHPTLDKALIAEALTLPDTDYVTGFVDVADPVAIHAVRAELRRALAEAHRDLLLTTFDENREQGTYSLDMPAVGRRRLKNLCLSYLLELDEPALRARALAQYHEAGNMTDALAALTALVHTAGPEHEEVLVAFYRRWRGDPLVLDKWFTLQATAPLPGTLARVRELTRHPDFNLKNPNRVRALIGAFSQRNPAQFHDVGGEGYALLAEHVLALDALNPQIAARLAGPFTQWRRYDPTRQALMRRQLERLLAAPGLSADVYEIASKSLA
ncbi:MAG: aminopeptidase N [Gammaproteobacteria bacterium]|nr:aminopeptidase N [Gammaproteobacteria bacterium]